MVHTRSVSTWFFIVYLGLANAQLLCPPITVADIGNTTALAPEGLLSRSLVLVGEGSQDPVPVRVLNYRVLCDASGSSRDTSSAVSVLVEFRCSFPGGTGNVADCNGNANLIRQYQYRCSEDNQWERASFPQTLSPSATFQTEQNNRCRNCLDPSIVSAVDADTHCLSCDPTMCNQGLRRCFIRDRAEVCCNFYLENECVATCPSSLVPNNNTFDCECAQLSLGNGILSPPDAVAIGSVVTHTCNNGYRLVGEGTLTCQRDGWSSTSPTCALIQCDEPPRIVMGNVIFSPENRTLGARATYSCKSGFALNGNKNRYCQSNSQWNGTDPKCEICEVNDPDCIECIFDESGNPVCNRCKDSLVLGSDGKCSDPNTSPSTGQCDTGCIVGIVLAILGAVIMAVVVTLVVYAVYSYLSNPATKLAKTGTEGLNGFARDNPLYLPPEDVVGDVETA